MMITNPGDRGYWQVYFLQVCDKCNCQYTYEITELVSDIDDDGTACPNCGVFNSHNNAVRIVYRPQGKKEEKEI